MKPLEDVWPFVSALSENADKLKVPAAFALVALGLWLLKDKLPKIELTVEKLRFRIGGDSKK